jgi:ABC-type protease/lipase transport system fused ATPase/permease subunit
LSSRPASGPAAAEADPVRSALEANGRLFGVALTFSAAMSVLALTTSFYML